MEQVEEWRNEGLECGCRSVEGKRSGGGGRWSIQMSRTVSGKSRGRIINGSGEGEGRSFDSGIGEGEEISVG